MQALFFAFFMFLINLQDVQTVNVTIEVFAPSTNDTTQIFITGNNPQIGYWNPGKVPLNNTGSHVWKKEFQFSEGSVIEYKITLGSFEKESADHKGRPFPNSILKVKNDTTVQKVIEFWKSGDFNIAGQITGDVRYHRKLSADTLLERDLIVWLPPGYNKNEEQRFPVLYMQDGQNIIDPKTASFKIDWQLDESADSLIRVAEIEPLIIVGIYNTSDRGEEYHPTPRGKLYRDFIIHTLKPFIDKTYRTKKDAKNCAVGGSSSGGILAFMLAWENPNVFSKAICMSAPLMYDDINYVITVKKYNGAKKNIRIYMDNGDDLLDEKLQPGINIMMSALDEKGYQKGKDYFWFKDKKAGHNEMAWAKRIPYILKLFYGI